MPIIRELAARVAAKYDNKDVQIIDEWNRVHMARMDMHYGFSVNGVAALHTEILKNVELKPFYEHFIWRNSTIRPRISHSEDG